MWNVSTEETFRKESLFSINDLLPPKKRANFSGRDMFNKLPLNHPKG
jgi:hypothetical protein